MNAVAWLPSIAALGLVGLGIYSLQAALVITTALLLTAVICDVRRATAWTRTT